MKRIILLLCSISVIAACTVDELNTAFSEPITDPNGVIIDHYPYLWARSHSADSAGTTARIVFKTPDCSLPMFDNGGKVIVGNVYGGITCLETDSGNVVWTCKLIDEFFTKPILDYIIASTEEWIILNMSGEFIKVDLKEGKVLGRCTIASHAESRMYRDGDICFYLSGNKSVYSVDCTSMDAAVDNTFDDVKFYVHVSIIPYTRNGERYRFIQEITSEASYYGNEYCVKLYLLLDNMGLYDTLYKSSTIQKNIEYIVNIEEYNGEIYFFTTHGFDVFDWEDKIISQQNVITKDYWCYINHEFYNNKMICRFKDLDNCISYLYDVYNKTILSKNNNEVRASKIFDGIYYSFSCGFFDAFYFENNRQIIHLLLVDDYMKVENISADKCDEMYEHAIWSNNNKNHVIISTNDNIFCFLGF
ncbi:MAG: hypothetical protein IKI28_07095 [Bacteroidales bacterium]|nr:hypothetical protein [Bacteroidales bacterium]